MIRRRPSDAGRRTSDDNTPTTEEPVPRRRPFRDRIIEKETDDAGK